MRFLSALFGAASLEAVHWYQLRDKLSQAKVRKALRSPGYWIITVVMIVLGAVGAWLYGDGLDEWKLAVAGAAFPALLTKAVAAFKPEHLHLGADDDAEGGLAIGEFFV